MVECFILLMKSVRKKGEASSFLRKLIFFVFTECVDSGVAKGHSVCTWCIVEWIFLTLVAVIWPGYVYFVND